jgi:hypothetical protein
MRGLILAWAEAQNFLRQVNPGLKAGAIDKRPMDSTIRPSLHLPRPLGLIPAPIFISDSIAPAFRLGYGIRQELGFSPSHPHFFNQMALAEKEARLTKK